MHVQLGDQPGQRCRCDRRQAPAAGRVRFRGLLCFVASCCRDRDWLCVIDPRSAPRSSPSPPLSFLRAQPGRWRRRFSRRRQGAPGRPGVAGVALRTASPLRRRLARSTQRQVSVRLALALAWALISRRRCCVRTAADFCVGGCLPTRSLPCHVIPPFTVGARARAPRPSTPPPLPVRTRRNPFSPLDFTHVRPCFAFSRVARARVVVASQRLRHRPTIRNGTIWRTAPRMVRLLA